MVRKTLPSCVLLFLLSTGLFVTSLVEPDHLKQVDPGNDFSGKIWCLVLANLKYSFRFNSNL